MVLERMTTIRTMTHEIPNRNPYGSGTLLITENVVTSRLPRADRTLTHLARYILKESGRDRVPAVERITGRAHIGEIR